ncbi:MAG TPA: hypothetical protein VK203_04920 [Nostocaceae cyanobacterium]|nr:hypothetical protein [Nostocaceae cyanobacterium]
MNIQQDFSMEKEVLRRFNEQASELRVCERFIKSLPEIKLEFNINSDELANSIQLHGLDKESLYGFILKLRFFLIKNEATSLLKNNKPNSHLAPKNLNVNSVTKS